MLTNNNEINNNIIQFKTNPNELKFLMNLEEHSFCDSFSINKCTVFKSISNILFLIYGDESIITYDIINNKITNKIKKPHNKYVSELHYYFDKFNKRDLIISGDENSLKLWNFGKWECLFYIQKINQERGPFCSCFLDVNNIGYICLGYCNLSPEIMEILDLNGKKIKLINDSKYEDERIYYIIGYYDTKISKNFILTGNYGYIKSYDYEQNKIYLVYKDEDKGYTNYNLIIYKKAEIIEIIAIGKGNIRIWDFHRGDLLNKIKFGEQLTFGACLWNDNYLIVGDRNKIKIVDLNNNIISNELIEHKNEVLTIIKINHPKYGECLISESCFKDQIKLWVNKNFI